MEKVNRRRKFLSLLKRVK